MTDMSDKGEAAANQGTALLLIDFINAMDFSGAEAMAPSAIAAARTVARLREAADAAKVPVVYVNDNYGQWHSERSRIVDDCRARNDAARQLADLLAPRHDDYFVIKPQFSGFYSTNLPVLLPKLGVRRLVMTGIAADICVLFTAADAHMRDYDLWVPADCVAGERPDHVEWALQIMEKSMGAETRTTSELRLENWMRRRG
jgi:nicotinamidase-related amidase